MTTRRLAAGLLALLVLARSSPARAQGAPDDLARAKELFRQGVALYEVGDYERALERFQRSRELFPSAKNGVDAALCLDRLGRYDEALEAYEDVLTRFARDLDEDDRAAIGPAMELLRGKVGSIEVSANVAAALVVDGRDRGKLPLRTPVRVLAGSRTLRLQKDGYATFETRVDVQVGRTVRVDGSLRPLASAGQLRVEDPDGAGAELFVDRARIGRLPWEGTLGPGAHVVWSRRGDVGSAPMRAMVVQGTTTLVRLKSAPLGPVVHVEVVPRTAAVEIDGVPLGPGRFDEPLPVGAHRILASEEGYRPRVLDVTEPPGGGAPLTVRIALAVDPAHPRWPKAVRGELWVGASVAALVSGSLGSDAEGDCPAACARDGLASGFDAALRAGYRFPFGLSLELGGGYMRVATELSRRATGRYGPGDAYEVAYALEDALRLEGPFAVAGASGRIGLGGRLSIGLRADVGVLFAASRDAISGTASRAGVELPLVVVGSGEPARSAAAFGEPEVTLGVRFGRLELHLGVGARVFVTDGPVLGTGPLAVPADTCPSSDPSSVGCARASAAVEGERAYGPFVVWAPVAGASWGF